MLCLNPCINASPSFGVQHVRGIVLQINFAQQTRVDPTTGRRGHIRRHGTGREAVLRPNTGLQFVYKLSKCFLPYPAMHKPFHRHGSIGCYRNTSPSQIIQPARHRLYEFYTTLRRITDGHVAMFSISGMGTMESSTSVDLSGPLKVFRCVITYQDTDVAYVQLYHMVVSSRIVQHQVVN